MAETMTPAAPAASPQGYAKSEATREAIITAALSAFGGHGFSAATTRQIAEAAGVALPAIAYHFGNKEGLYLACARDIVARYYAQAADLALEAGLALEAAPPPDVCSDYLRHILRRLLRLFAQDEASGSQADFVAREMRDRGPAFQILYDQLWAPGVEITARLVAGCQGRKAVQDGDRAEALMLISSLLAFNTGRDVALQILGRPNLDAGAVNLIDAAIDRIVDGVAGRTR